MHAETCICLNCLALRDFKLSVIFWVLFPQEVIQTPPGGIFYVHQSCNLWEIRPCWNVSIWAHGRLWKMLHYAFKCFVTHDFRRNELKNERQWKKTWAEREGKDEWRNKGVICGWLSDENVFVFKGLLLAQLEIYYNLAELRKCK